MLIDSEISELRKETNYQNFISTKFEHIGKDILNSTVGELNPEISVAIRIIKYFMKSRIIRKEFSVTTKRFLEDILNRSLNYSREPQLVRETCESSNDFIWMRYDEERVKALLNKAIDLLKDADYRNLIKTKSTVKGDQDDRLNIIIKEIRILLKRTVLSIKFKGVYDELITFSNDEYFELHGEEIQAEFIRRIHEGKIGLLPTKKHEEKNDDNEQ